MIKLKEVCDENYKVKLSCAEALGKIGDKYAVLPLMNIVEDETESSVYVKESAVSALGMIGDEKAVDSLVSILESKKGFLDKFTFLKERALEALNKLNYPWYYVIGNHDTTTDGYLNKTNIVKILKEKNPNYIFDSTYYTFTPQKGIRVIVMDGAKNKGISSHGVIPSTQLCWLDEILDKSKKDVVLIFIHFPLLPPFESKNHEILNVDEFKSVLNKYEMPIAIFAGHYHAAKITKRGNILHVSSPSLAGYPNAFRIIEIDNRRKQVVFNFRFMETNLKDLQSKTKILTLGGAKYYGKPSDRETTIIMDKR